MRFAYLNSKWFQINDTYVMFSQLIGTFYLLYVETGYINPTNVDQSPYTTKYDNRNKTIDKIDQHTIFS